MSPRDKLIQAEMLIAEVMASLDIQMGVCEHCTLKHYTNWQEHQAHVELGSVRKKLMKLVHHPMMWLVDVTNVRSEGQ
jgi:hypothetical protein